MSLRQQLAPLLVDLLPASPGEALKGTELIRLLRLRLEGNYSDASLRYHFSIMSCDPSSPIAKVEQGQGYYLRNNSPPTLSDTRELAAMQQARLDDPDGTPNMDRALLRIRKFRAILRKHATTRGLLNFPFREALSDSAPLGNLWKFPEMVLVDWQQGEPTDEGLELDRAHLAIKQSLGLPPYHLTSIRTRILAGPDSFREDFFQTLAASLWANSGELCYASAVTDEYLAAQLRELASRFNIGVTTFGLTPEALDDLPHPVQIDNALDRETEALMSRLQVEHLAPAPARSHCDWAALENLRRDHPEMNQLLAWLGGALESGTARPFQQVSRA